MVTPRWNRIFAGLVLSLVLFATVLSFAGHTGAAYEDLKPVSSVVLASVTGLEQPGQGSITVADLKSGVYLSQGDIEEPGKVLRPAQNFPDDREEPVSNLPPPEDPEYESFTSNRKPSAQPDVQGYRSSLSGFVWYGNGFIQQTVFSGHRLYLPGGNAGDSLPGIVVPTGIPATIVRADATTALSARSVLPLPENFPIFSSINPKLEILFPQILPEQALFAFQGINYPCFIHKNCDSGTKIYKSEGVNKYALPTM